MKICKLGSRGSLLRYWTGQMVPFLEWEGYLYTGNKKNIFFYCNAEVYVGTFAKCQFSFCDCMYLSIIFFCLVGIFLTY